MVEGIHNFSEIGKLNKVLLHRPGLELEALTPATIERLLFDAEASAQGMENRIVPAEMGDLLERIYRWDFASGEASHRMVRLLLEQQINHKIPGYLPEGTMVAHKTGEDEGITNDVGVVYGEKPYIICFASNFTNVPAAEIALREISLALLER